MNGAQNTTVPSTNGGKGLINNEIFEMGVPNAGYNADRPASLHSGRLFSPYAIDTPADPNNTSSIKKDSVQMKDVDPTYLTPVVDGSHGHQYEDLTQLAAKIQEDRNNKEGGPRKKANLFYETNPTEIRDYKSNKTSNSDLCCLRFMVGLLCCFVLFLLLLIVLVIVGTVKIQDLDCTKCSGGSLRGSTGATVDTTMLLNQIARLEKNLTDVYMVLETQKASVSVVANHTSVQQDTIDALNGRITSAEQFSSQINRTISIDGQLTKRNLEYVTSLVQNLTTMKSMMLDNFDNLQSNWTHAQRALQSNITIISRLLHTEADNRSKNDSLLSMKLNSSLNALNSKVQFQIDDLVSSNDNANVTMTSLKKQIFDIVNLNASNQPPGANFSECKLQTFVQDSDIVQPNPEQATVFISEGVPQGYVVVGASCSSEQAIHTRLHATTSFLSCRCSSATVDITVSKLECYLHMWMCPVSN